MNAETRIELTARHNAESLALARWVSLATRVDPALLRRARLGLMRGASAAAESDLWFSPLVQTAGARYILFYPDVVNLLRGQLAANRRHLALAWRVTRKTHRTLPELVRLEEKLTWLALKGGPRLEQRIDARLRPLIKAMLTGQREGLGRWALNVMPHMPAGARESKSARLLRVIAESQLYGGWVNLLTTSGEGPTDEEAAMLLHGLEPTVAGLRLKGDRLEVSEPPEDDSRLIKVPATNPRVLELAWASGDAQEQTRLTWRKGERTHAARGGVPASVNTLAGESHKLVRADAAVSSYPGLNAPFVVFIVGRNGGQVGVGVLVEHDFVLTSIRSIRSAVDPLKPDSTPFPVNFLSPHPQGGFARPLRAVPPLANTGTLHDHMLLLKLEESSRGVADPAKLRSAFDLIGRVLAAPGSLPPYDIPHRWATFEVGAATESGDFPLIPATQIRPDNLRHWSGAPLIDTATGEVAGVALLDDDQGGPRLSLFSLNQIARDFPEIFDTGSTVLLSHNAHDGEFVEEFRTRMEAAGLGDRVVMWQDTLGSVPEGEGLIERGLGAAAAVVMFVSPAYLDSPFIEERRLLPLLERAERKGGLILPVVADASRFLETGFARFQAANDPRRPLNTLSGGDREHIYERLCAMLSRRLGVTSAESERPQPQAAAYDFFIRHVQADAQWAAWMAEQLSEAGYSALVMGRESTPDSSASEIQRAVAQAACTVVVLSQDYLDSKNEMNEMTHAFAYDPTVARPLLPVRVGEVSPRGFLAQQTNLDLVGLSELSARSALINVVRSLLPNPTRTRPPETGGGARVAFPGIEPPRSAPPFQFKTDIFLSFARIDNEPYGDMQGWVDTFSKGLRVRVAQLLGEEPTVWQDTTLPKSDYFDEAIPASLADSCLFVSVVSPGYVKSDWCRRELVEFVRRAREQPAGLDVSGRSRIFKVTKTPVDRNELPEELHDLLGYEFYELDEGGRPREFWPDQRDDRNKHYWKKLDDLAYDIAQTLKAFKYAPADARPVEEKKAVYLARTGDDLTRERDRIRDELQLRGYRVLPDRELPLRSPDFEQTVRGCLARCVLAVHLVGAHPGIAFGGGGSPVAQREAELAAERAARDAQFRWLIWMPPGIKPRDTRHLSFINRLMGGPIAPGMEILQTSLEELKERLHDLLAGRPKDPPAETVQGRLVYLVCDREDAEEARRLEDLLHEGGFDLLLPVVKGDEAALLKDHKAKLAGADAVVIYCGRAGEAWLRKRERDLMKAAAGRRRKKPYSARAVYLGPPFAAWKERFRSRELLVMKNFREVSSETLLPLLELLEPPAAG